MLEDNAGDGKTHEEQVEYQVLAPGQLADHPTAGAGDIMEKMEEDGAGVDREQAHQDQGCDETGFPASFEDQGERDRDLQARNGPDQVGGKPGWEGLITHLADETFEI